MKLHRFAAGCVVAALFGLAVQLSAQQPVYRKGSVPPQRLLRVSSKTARAQTFAADGDQLTELQLMVGATAAGPLLVEVRSSDLTRWYGGGSITAAGTDLGWKSVEWEATPNLSEDEKYAIVLWAPPNSPAWLASASSSDVYPWGGVPSFSYSPSGVGCSRRKDGGYSCDLMGRRYQEGGYDLAFRARYRNGKITDSPLRVPESAPPIREISVDVDPLPVPRVGKAGPVLPMCAGAICADPTENLIGDLDARASRGKASFVECAPDTLHMRSPTAGLSCRDVCRSAGYAGCHRTIGNDVSACTQHEFSTVASCDAVLGSREARRAQMICECGAPAHEPKILPSKKPYYPPPDWQPGVDGTFVRLESKRVTVLGPAGATVVPLSFRYDSPTVIGEWLVLKSSYERRFVALSRDGSKHELAQRDCERAHLVRFRDQPWAACFRDDAFVLQNVVSKEVLKPPPEPEYYRVGPPISAGERIFFLGLEHRWAWRPGESGWTKLGGGASMAEPSANLAELLSELVAEEPGFPRVVDGIYYGPNGWSYDTRSKRFLHSDLKVGAQYEASPNGVRYGAHLLHPASGQFRRAPVPASTSWSGHSALREVWYCPRGRTCPPLPSPYEHLAIVSFDPVGLTEAGAIRMREWPEAQ